jgi:membrane associated rhomboid family serine protease
LAVLGASPSLSGLLFCLFFLFIQSSTGIIYP